MKSLPLVAVFIVASGAADAAAVATLKPPTPVAVARLNPMTREDIEKTVQGCLGGPVPADGGLPCFRSNGHVSQFIGFRYVEYDYLIVNNTIVIVDPNHGNVGDSKPEILSFYRDHRGKPYFRYGDGGVRDEAYPLVFAASSRQERHPRKIRPLGNPDNWITSDDYPPIDQRDHHEGIVFYTLQVDPEGRASDCTITKSSGYSSLDQTSCNLALRRARFAPALDATGKPVGSIFSYHVAWRIPD